MPGPGFEWMGKEEEIELLDVIRGGWLFRYGDENNPNFKHKVKTLENEVCKKFRVKYALAVSSGTAALIAALSAAGVGPGDEVIVPGYTFIASISSIIICRAIPVLAEVDESLNIDPEDVEKKITPHTKAILAVHMLGNPCDLGKLQVIAEKHNLTLIEDAAQAFGGSYKGKKLGTIGTISIYSFNIFKVINSGDGGMVVTDNKKLYSRAFAYHDQGHFPLRMGVEIGKRSIIGQDFRMNELTGAVLLAQFHKLDKILKHLRNLKSSFKKEIEDIKRIEYRKINDSEGECATLLTVFLPDRSAAESVAAKLGTTTALHSGWHVYNNMEQLLRKKTITDEGCPFSCPYYKGSVEYKKGMLPQTDSLLGRAINISIGVVDKGIGAAFGIHINSTYEDVREKAEKFREVVKEFL